MANSFITNMGFFVILAMLNNTIKQIIFFTILSKIKSIKYIINSYFIILTIFVFELNNNIFWYKPSFPKILPFHQNFYLT